MKSGYLERHSFTQAGPLQTWPSTARAFASKPPQRAHRSARVRSHSWNRRRSSQFFLVLPLAGLRPSRKTESPLFLSPSRNGISFAKCDSVDSEKGDPVHWDLVSSFWLRPLFLFQKTLKIVPSWHITQHLYWGCQPVHFIARQRRNLFFIPGLDEIRTLEGNGVAGLGLLDPAVVSPPTQAESCRGHQANFCLCICRLLTTDVGFFQSLKMFLKGFVSEKEDFWPTQFWRFFSTQSTMGSNSHLTIFWWKCNLGVYLHFFLHSYPISPQSF